ncbi:hypothetical protein V8G54_010148 [Vigna mungo]|uniref:Uncharacterized protein n=1 Tax=Vigna mungo TaxID=3915 RepID=A0AAQ3NY06_VIGMU
MWCLLNDNVSVVGDEVERFFVGHGTMYFPYLRIRCSFYDAGAKGSSHESVFRERGGVVGVRREAPTHVKGDGDICLLILEQEDFGVRYGDSTGKEEGLRKWKSILLNLIPQINSFVIVISVRMSGGCRPLPDQDRIKIKNALRAIKVQVNHGQNIRRYKVTVVTKEPLRALMESVVISTENPCIILEGEGVGLLVIKTLYAIFWDVMSFKIVTFRVKPTLHMVEQKFSR